MGENVTFLGDLADRFDALVAYDEKALDLYVEDSGYSTGSMVLASTALAFIQFSQGFVDMGRIGNGILIEGGWKGVGNDVLRGLGLVGGAGAVIGRGSRLLKVTQVATHNTCAWVAQTNALRLSGQRWLITMRDLAARANVNLQQVAQYGRGAQDYVRMMNVFQQMNVPFRILGQSQQPILAINAILRGAPRSVVTFSLRFTRNGANHGHRLYATWGRLTGPVFRDPHGQVYHGVRALERAFGSSLQISASPIIAIPNSLLMVGSEVAQTLGGLAGVALQLMPKLDVRAADPMTAAQSLHVRDQYARHAAVPPLLTHPVVAGESLSGIAEKHYAETRKWPVIFEANRKRIGPDPARIRTGIELEIPPLPRVELMPADRIGRGGSLPPITVA